MSFLASGARTLALDAAFEERFHPAKLAVFEWQDYFFQFPGASFLRVGNRHIEPLAPGFFRVRWENALGLSLLQPEGGERFWVEVLSPKFPTFQSHFELLGALLGSLFERSRHLTWSFRGETARGSAPGATRLSPLETLEWMGQNAPEIELLWTQILRAPRPRLQNQRVLQSATQVSRVDSAALRDAAQNPARWVGNTPRELLVPRAQWRYDTPEIRRALLLSRELWRDWQLARRQPYFAALDTQNQPLFAHLPRLFAQMEARFGTEIGPHTESCKAAPRSEIEARLERLAQSRTARGHPIWAGAERFANVRDVAGLWEFWTFWALVHAIETALQMRAQIEARFDESRGMLAPSRAVWGDFSLVFNGPAPSYSTPLRPDFLWLRGKRAVAAFDAKFRFDGENLHKMHAYCDALQIGAAVALYPHPKTTFFDRARGPLSQIPLRALLEEHAHGVGLWGILPEDSATINSQTRYH